MQWIGIFCVLSAILSVLCLYGCLSVVRAVNHDWASVLARLRSNELRLTSIENSEAERAETMQQLANSVKMTKVRKAITHTERDKGGEPDAKSDPEAWRAWKNAQLRAGVFNS